MDKTLEEWKEEYKNALQDGRYEYIDEIIMRDIWGNTTICDMYMEYARSLDLDPLQADERYDLSVKFAHGLLTS